MYHIWIVILSSLLLLSGCYPGTDVSTVVFPTTAPSTPISLPEVAYYVSSTLGSDVNPGTEALPWQTIQKAVKSIKAGDTVYIRGGEYATLYGGWTFQNSGLPGQPITVSNYPGEQVVIRISDVSLNYNAFRCLYSSVDSVTWQTTKAEYIHIAGSDVSPRTLSNGVESVKGIVIQGVQGEQAAGISGGGCDYWEVSGVDFVQVAYGIFTFKKNFQGVQEYSADNWHVHNNRVYNYYRESGMQFNGNNNLVEKNEVYKVSDQLDTPYGCQLLNFLGNGNVVRQNTLSRLGSAARCGGILFEWDLADRNLVERNYIYDVPWGVRLAGGDNNIFRNNLIEAAGGEFGILISSYDTRTAWPCDEPGVILPANDPAAPDYAYYYNPRNCHSFGNQIYNNTIHGFVEGINMFELYDADTLMRNNVISGWTRGGICYRGSLQYVCDASLPAGIAADHNAIREPFGFVNLQAHDFHLSSQSVLVDAGVNLGELNPNDYDGNGRAGGAAYDIGAYEFIFP